MKNLLKNKSPLAEMLSNPQSAGKSIAIMAKGEIDQYDAFKYEMASFDHMNELDDKPIDIDEMQIDKLYQSL